MRIELNKQNKFSMRIEQSMARDLWLVKRYSNIYFSLVLGQREERTESLKCTGTLL